MTRRATAVLLVTLLTAAGARPLRAQGTADGAPMQTQTPPTPTDDVEPPPAPLEEPEPDPAPLQIEKTAAERAAEAEAERAAAAEVDRRARLLRTYTGLGYTGVAITVALAVAGTTLGVLAQQRSDAQSRLTTQIIDGMPPVYDAAQDSEWARLHDEGMRFNRATIGCLVSAGVMGVATGLLFWGRERRFGKDLALSIPSLRADSRGVALSIEGRF